LKHNKNSGVGRPCSTNNPAFPLIGKLSALSATVVLKSFRCQAIIYCLKTSSILKNFTNRYVQIRVKRLLSEVNKEQPYWQWIKIDEEKGCVG